jgi:hypothetical protein
MKDSKSPIETPSHRAKRTLSRRVKKVRSVVELKLSKEEIKFKLDPPDPPPIPFKHINAPEQIRGNVGSGGVASLQIDSNPSLTGEIQLVSGTNITLSQTGQVITISTSPGLISYSKDSFTVTVPSNKQFNLSHIPVANSEIVTWNGMVLRPGIPTDPYDDYIVVTIPTPKVELSGAIVLHVGDIITVSYAR